MANGCEVVGINEIGASKWGKDVTGFGQNHG